MPHYHFHTLHGRPLRDREGEELANPASARRRALRIMGEILRDSSVGFWAAGPFSVICTDAKGALVTGLVAEEMSAEAAARMLRDIEAQGIDDPDGLSG